jgi:tight adherence protein B
VGLTRRITAPTAVGAGARATSPNPAATPDPVVRAHAGRLGFLPPTGPNPGGGAVPAAAGRPPSTPSPGPAVATEIAPRARRRWPVSAGRRARARLGGLVDDRRTARRDAAPALETVTGGAAVAVVVAALFGPVVLVIVLIVAAVGRVAWRRRAAALLDRRRRGQLPEALERMAAALRTGSSPPQALAEAARGTTAPLGSELDTLANLAERGQPMVTVLDGWTAQHPDLGTRLAAVALALATGVGAAPARALDGVAATLRERLELADERHALATQARASAVVLSAAPPVFAALLTLGDPEASRFLFQTPPGWLCIALGVGLDLIGAVWMTRLTRGGAA